jgi:predicted amidohydrolase
MKVALIQTSLLWEQPEANRSMLGEKMIPLAGRTDIIVLPEMFPTGFSMNAEQLADAPDGPTFQWMREQAKSTGAVVTGSFICREKDRFTNRLLWVQPDGETVFYDKKHLFSLAGEHEVFSPGATHLTVTWKGFRIRPLICYDLRFPVWARQPVAPEERYDLLLYVANWPQRRVHHWKALLVARAIENQCFTVGLNIVGTDGAGLEYTGDSMITDFFGHVLSTGSMTEQTLITDLDLAKLQAYRTQFPFLDDADNFCWH